MKNIEQVLQDLKDKKVEVLGNIYHDVNNYRAGRSIYKDNKNMFISEESTFYTLQKIPTEIHRHIFNVLPFHLKTSKKIRDYVFGKVYDGAILFEEFLFIKDRESLRNHYALAHTPCPYTNKGDLQKALVNTFIQLKAKAVSSTDTQRPLISSDATIRLNEYAEISLGDFPELSKFIIQNIDKDMYAICKEIFYNLEYYIPSTRANGVDLLFWVGKGETLYLYHGSRVRYTTVQETEQLKNIIEQEAKQEAKQEANKKRTFDNAAQISLYMLLLGIATIGIITYSVFY